MALGGLVLGSLILYLKGMRIMMFQLSGFYYIFTEANRPPPQPLAPFKPRSALHPKPLYLEGQGT